MPRKKREPTRPQKIAAYAVLAVLVLIALWVGRRQADFNPAVQVYLTAPKATGAVQAGAPAAPGGPGGAPASLDAAVAGPDLIPAVPGFTVQTPAENFNPETLSDKIDGKAELYLPAGFVRMQCQRLISGAVRLEAFVYDMAKPDNAFAVFSSQRRPDGKPAPGLGSDAYATDNALFFTHGGYYVEIVAGSAGAETQKALLAVATAVSAKLPGAAAPASAKESDLLPRDGLDAASVRLVAADAFGLEGFQNVYTGDYKLPQGEGTVFVAKKTDPAKTKATADKYAAYLRANGYKPLSDKRLPAGVTALTLENSSFEILMLQSGLLAGVHDAQSLDAAVALAVALDKNLRGLKP